MKADAYLPLSVDVIVWSSSFHNPNSFIVMLLKDIRFHPFHLTSWPAIIDVNIICFHLLPGGEAKLLEKLHVWACAKVSVPVQQ